MLVIQHLMRHEALSVPRVTLTSICPALPCHTPALPCPALPCPALPCPALPCPALPCPALCTSNVGQVPEVWAACPDWRLHGHQQLCASGHSGRHGADLWQHLPWGWPRHEQSPVQEDPGVQRGLPPPPPLSHTSCLCSHGHNQL